MSRRTLVLIKGAGDLATGCAVRLHKSGFAVVMTELPAPTAVRRTVAFSEAVVDGSAAVEGVLSSRARDVGDVRRIIRAGHVAVLVDPDDRAWAALAPPAIVDARMAKKNLGTACDQAPVVVGLGPGFTAGLDVHAVIETNRGHTLGSVILDGAAEPNTGLPGEIGGYGIERLLRAPAAGRLRACSEIGERVEVGTVVGEVAGQPLRARVAGVLRGLLRDGSVVSEGQKVGDIDPRARREHCFTVSDKARAVAGGVLEGLLSLRNAAKSPPKRLRLPTAIRGSPRPRSPRAGSGSGRGR